jgi:hypothetical protein
MFEKYSEMKTTKKKKKRTKDGAQKKKRKRVSGTKITQKHSQI